MERGGIWRDGAVAGATAIERARCEAIHTDAGTELKRFHVRDGSAVKVWQQQGKTAAFLTGRSSPAVAARARELGILTLERARELANGI